MRKALRRGFLPLLLAAAPAWLVAADSATVVGTVTGITSPGLPGATITLTSETGAVAATVSAGQGTFRITGQPPGRYTLRAELPGFVPAEVPGLELQPGLVRTVHVALADATFSDAIEVLGAASDQLTASELRGAAACELTDGLTRVAGISRLRKGGIASDIVLRGYREESLNVLVDGVRVQGACPSHMDPPAFHTDLAEVDHVDIGKGPFDVRNGGSLGGVVNLVTRKPERGFSLAPNLTLGSFGYRNPSVVASHGGERFTVLAGLSTRSGDPYRDGAGRRFTELANYRTDARDATAFELTSGWLRLGADLTEKQSMHLSYVRQEADQVLYPYLFMDGVYDNTDRFNLGWERTPEDGPAVRAHAYVTRVRHWMTDELRTSSSGAARTYSMGSQAGTDTLGIKAEVEAGPVVVGVEGLRREWRMDTYLAGMRYAPQHAIPDVAIDSAGVFAEIERSLTPRLRLSAGARFDRAETAADRGLANTDLYWAYQGTRSTATADSYPSGNVRLAYQAGPALELGAGVGTTVRIPDARERFFALKRMGSDWVGNPDLQPARNTGLALQAIARWVGAVATASLFADRLDDAIVVHNQARVNTTPGVMNAKAYSYTNVDARQWGGELSLVVPIADTLFLSGDLAYVRGSKDPRPELGIRSSVLAQMPPLTTRIALRWDRGRFFAEAEGVFASSQNRVDTDLQEEPTPGWGIANLRLGGRAGGFALALALRNLLDRNYYEHLSFLRDPFRSGARVTEPGRSASLNLSYTL